MSDIEAYKQHGSKAAAARALGVPVSTFKDRLKRATHTSTLYDADGNEKLIWVKARENSLTPAEVGEQIRAALDGYAPPTTFPAEPENTDKDLATVYPLADWHVGLLSWAKETKHNYDLKIGRATIQTAMTRLVSTTPRSSQAVLLGLGDLLHSDNYDNQTSRSKNVLDVDGRYPRVLQTATELVMFSADLALAKHENVLIRILPGNHDDQSALAVTLALSLYYKYNERVTVDDDAGRFWWWLWGKVFLGATHGDKAKMRDLPLIMAARNPDLWGKAKFRHIYTGHIHKETGIEMSGVTVESFQTPVAPDAWHVSMGYGAGRSVSAITHHREQGEVIRNKVNII
jgi:hypothetical protein